MKVSGLVMASIKFVGHKWREELRVMVICRFYVFDMVKGGDIPIKSTDVTSDKGERSKAGESQDENKGIYQLDINCVHVNYETGYIISVILEPVGGEERPLWLREDTEHEDFLIGVKLKMEVAITGVGISAIRYRKRARDKYGGGRY